MSATGEFYKAQLERFQCEWCENKYVTPHELYYVFHKPTHLLQCVCLGCADKLKKQGYTDLEHPNGEKIHPIPAHTLEKEKK